MRALFLLFIISPLFVFSQNKSMSKQYYGNKKGLGELEFLNDTMYRAAFYFNIVGIQEYDTGYYRVNEDTVFLSSKSENALIALPYYERTCLGDASVENDKNVADAQCYSVTVFRKHGKLSVWQKIANPFRKQKEYKSKERHYSFLMHMYRHIRLDTVDSILILPFCAYPEDILVVETPDGYSKRIMIPADWHAMGGTTFIKLNDEKPFRVYLDDFPLLIKKNRLKPCSKEANHKCYINNGFVFPEMSVNKPPAYIFRHSVYYYYSPYRGFIGLAGFKYGKEQAL